MKCAQCGRESTGSKYCPHCGVSLYPGSWTSVGALIRIVPIGIAIVASFLPWLTIGVVTRTRHWNAYQIGGFSWLWLALAVVAVGLLVTGSRRVIPQWIQSGISLFSGLTLGVGISAFVLVQVSSRVSHILSAPDPLKTSYGVLVFAIAAALWCIVNWTGGLDARGASHSVPNSPTIPPGRK